MSAQDARRQLRDISVRKRERCEEEVMLVLLQGVVPVLAVVAVAVLPAVVEVDGQGASVLEFECVRHGRQRVIFAL